MSVQLCRPPRPTLQAHKKNTNTRILSLLPHSFSVLKRLISSSGDYDPFPPRSSRRAEVTQLDEYLIWNVAFRASHSSFSKKRVRAQWKDRNCGLNRLEVVCILAEQAWCDNTTREPCAYCCCSVSLNAAAFQHKQGFLIIPVKTLRCRNEVVFLRRSCLSLLTRPYLDTSTPKTWPEATSDPTVAPENKQRRGRARFVQDANTDRCCWECADMRCT